MPAYTVVRPEISEKFRRFLEKGRVLLFSAPCGFGKTAVSEKLLKGKRVLRMQADDPTLPEIDLDSFEIVLADNTV